MAEPVLEARGLTRRFGALVANRNVTLDLRAGEIHAVIGPNGAGKSTLIAQLCGQVAPDAGTVRLDGHDVTGWSVERRARAGIARTFQVSQLAVEDSVRQNVVLAALRGARPGLWRSALVDRTLRDRAEAALARVGLDGPDRSVAALSHGQRRQLEIAMALALAPRVFVMDEPMAGLGGEGTRQLTRLLDGLRTEAPILLVEHDMDAVFALADRVSVMVEGAVIATGTVAEIRADAAVRDAYLGAEA